MRKKLGNTPVKVLKSILIDFYDVQLLWEAKVCLLDGIGVLVTLVKIPQSHIPRRRDGNNCIAREVDDIVAIFSQLDEHKLINQLPRYCVSGPDETPSSRICEGDLNVFMIMLEKLHGKTDEFWVGIGRHQSSHASMHPSAAVCGLCSAALEGERSATCCKFHEFCC